MALYNVNFKLSVNLSPSQGSNAEHATLPNFVYASSFENAVSAAAALSLTYWVVSGIQFSNLKVLVGS